MVNFGLKKAKAIQQHLNELGCFIQEMDSESNSIFAIWEIDSSGRKKRKYPMVNFGLKKAKAIQQHLDELSCFIQEMEFDWTCLAFLKQTLHPMFNRNPSKNFHGIQKPKKWQCHECCYRNRRTDTCQGDDGTCQNPLDLQNKEEDLLRNHDCVKYLHPSASDENMWSCGICGGRCSDIDYQIFKLLLLTKLISHS